MLKNARRQKKTLYVNQPEKLPVSEVYIYTYRIRNRIDIDDVVLTIFPCLVLLHPKQNVCADIEQKTSYSKTPRTFYFKYLRHLPLKIKNESFNACENL